MTIGEMPRRFSYKSHVLLNTLVTSNTTPLVDYELDQTEKKIPLKGIVHKC